MFEKHEKGILSIAWCPQDSDLLLSAGKDNHVYCFNPNSAEYGGEVSSIRLLSDTSLVWALDTCDYAIDLSMFQESVMASLSTCVFCAFSFMVKCAPGNLLTPPHPQVVYEVPSTSQWCFDVQWCPRNPGLISTSSFDGHISVYSLLGGAGGEEDGKEVGGGRGRGKGGRHY